MYRFVSYNVLARDLEEQLESSPHTPFEERLPKLIKRITSFLAEGVVLALQEVSEETYTALEPLFVAYHYEEYYYPYKNHGLLLAAPSSLEIKSYGRKTLGEMVREKSAKLDPKLGYKLRGRNSKQTAVQLAAKQEKPLLWLELEGGGERFFVFNAHFPVSFYWLAKAGAYISVAVEAMYLIAAGNPFVLLTDFNFSEESAPYKYITGRQIKKGLYPHPHWTFLRHPGLMDARRTLGQKGITTRCKQKGAPVFEGCLDYVFLSPQWLPVSFEQGKVYGLLPSAEEGSDHIPVCCTAQLR